MASLQVTAPEISELWHPTRNGDLKPSDVTRTSRATVWWRCSQGHEMQKSVISMGMNPTCGYCKGRRVVPGFNDLETLHPEVAAEWHPTRNGDLRPSDIIPGSATKVWWTCAQGHESLKRVVDAVSFGCKHCVGGQVLEGFNDLVTLRPDIAALWHPEKNGYRVPESTGAGTTAFAWWQCSSGHEWEQSVYRVGVTAQPCPTCRGWRTTNGRTDMQTTLRRGINDLATLRPEMVELWHPTRNGDLAPEDVYARSTRRVWWRCISGHEVERSVLHFKGSCSLCIDHVTHSENNLAVRSPQLSAQWHPTKNGELTPETTTFSSKAYVWWVCDIGHEWEMAPHYRYWRSTGCPVCASTGTSGGEQELLQFVTTLGHTEAVNRHRTGNPHTLSEVDVYVPSKQIAFEFNGLYWHSVPASFGRDDRHLAKSLACEAEGIRLVHVWEDDWRYRRGLVMGMIARVLGVASEQAVNARQTSVVELGVTEARAFLERYHIQGYGNSTWRYGLVSKDGDLVAVVTVKRRSAEGEWEIVRYATSCNVRGGFTKLLRAIDVRLIPARIVTFSDNSWSQGNLYAASGFVHDGDLAPDYSYVVNGRRVHKFGYRVSRFRSDTGLVYQDGLTEAELAGLNGMSRIYDAGKRRWTLTPPHGTEG